MTLQGYSIPRTTTGDASLVPPPPWHYVGDFLVVDYWADPAACTALLPPGLDPHPDPGRCAAVFADWQSCSEGGDELTDPIRSHYREFFIVVNALLDGEEVTTCPFIWVDQDFALARGWIQGFPKKLGSIWMTRTFGLEGVVDDGPRHNAPPIVNVRHFPRLAAGRHDDPQVHELVRAVSRDRAGSAVHAGPATLTLHAAPHEEHDALAPLKIDRGYRFTFGYTVDDLVTVKEIP